jgi:hypothetical protein
VCVRVRTSTVSFVRARVVACVCGVCARSVHNIHKRPVPIDIVVSYLMNRAAAFSAAVRAAFFWIISAAPATRRPHEIRAIAIVKDSIIFRKCLCIQHVSHVRACAHTRLSVLHAPTHTHAPAANMRVHEHDAAIA